MPERTQVYTEVERVVVPFQWHAVYSFETFTPEATMNAITRPEPSEYLEYYETYISKFTPTDFWAELDGQPSQLRTLLGNLPAGEESKLHEPTSGL